MDNNLDADLGRIPHQTMADIVETRLLEYLKKKSFKPGDALPTELDLAEALGVSRNVLREALSRLRMLGMVETRKKRGMVLARPDILGPLERVLDPLIIDQRTLRDIFELRLTLEVGLADLLYLRKTDKDVEELEAIAKDQKNLGGVTFRINNEIAFHGKIYQMTGNDTLKRFQTMLLPIFGYLVALEKVPRMGQVSHLDLVELLKHGTKEEFRQGMLNHLQHHFDKLA
ncbi:MAG TPA: GntR family transcriptional regulator [Dinghuibacter sp.]|uniref:FadR/GntR family transcriptional regulator n=1 Tax=Dinghuibacter sp. TaxID=2024697 RepID=UPI002CDED82D|nr:GntR family transcriptional regulator [Dinghuibacter sp.]HTJ10541.1 GntR family transcriptional regulator [Dinghuibacter sp.]